MSARALTPEIAGTVSLPQARLDLRQQPPPPGWLVIAAFAAVYLIWGSTYLGIHVAVETIPPFFMAGSRFVIAGAVLYVAMRASGAPRPELVHWRTALITGALLLVIGNGALSWVQQFTPTNISAMMIAATPLWMNLVDWWRPGGRRPQRRTVAGLILGFIGVALIVLSRDPGGHRVLLPLGAAVLLLAPFSWAIGSIYSRHAPQCSTSLLNIAMQMLAGGVLMLLVGLVRGEQHGFALSQISASSAWAFLYLTTIGSLVGFTAYAWLLQVSTPAKVSTYAYVNPLIAVLLGSIVLKESLPTITLLAGSLILAAVVTITLRTSKLGPESGRRSGR